MTAPSFPSCTGFEPLVVANDNIAVSQTKYFYGSAASLANVKLRGGTLVICGDLTLTEFVFDSGTVFIQPAASLIVSNGAGLVVKGNTAIYNAGTFQCLGNYVMDGSYASPSKPNVIINTSPTSWLKMQNQYFVINNPYSKIVNNGVMDFHGLITDPSTAAGSVCLGYNSQIRMTVLYNKVKHPYIAPAGPACVSVSQYSQFHDTLTVYPNINFCLGSGHTSDASCIPWGCKPNAWGGQVSNNCSNCNTVLTFLAINIKRIEAIAHPNFNEITWQVSDAEKQMFYIQRSIDGINFITIDSIKADEKTRYSFKDYSFKNYSYYKIIYYANNQKISSDVAEVRRAQKLNEVYPNPFKNFFVIPIHSLQAKKISIKITDVYGRQINSFKISVNEERATLYFENIASGVYLVTVTDGKQNQVYKVMKQ